MTPTLRLAVRFMSRSRGRELIRSVTTVVGTAAASCGLLISLAVPMALLDSAARAGSRMPQLGNVPAAKALTYTAGSQFVGTREWTQVQLTGPATSSLVPPGLLTLPAVGHTVVSPALHRLLEERPYLRLGLGEVDTAAIRPAGLLAPNELLSYSRLAAGSSTADGVSNGVIGFGHASASGPPVGLLTEVIVLLFAPTVFFWIAAATQALAARRRRVRALWLLGLTPTQAGRLLGIELGTLSSLGAIAGWLIYRSLETALSSGPLGLQWFCGGATTSRWMLAVLAIAAFAIANATGRGARSVSLMPPDATAARQSPPMIVGLTLLVPTFVFIVVYDIRVAALGSASALPAAWFMPTILLCAVLTVAGLGLAMPGLLRSAAVWLSRHAGFTTWRIGFRKAAYARSATRKFSVATLLLIFAGFAGQSFLEASYLDAVGDPGLTRIQIPLSGLTVRERADLRSIAPGGWSIVAPAFMDGLESPAMVHVMNCQDYLRELGRPDLRTCKNTPLRVAMSDEFGALAPGAALRVALANGRTHVVVAPRASLGVNGAFELLLPPESTPWAWNLRNGVVEVRLANTSADAFMASCAERVPSARPRAVLKDPEALARFNEQSAIIGTALLVAALLIAGAFLMVVLESSVDSARSDSVLLALGTPRRVVAWSRVLQNTFPVLLQALVTLPVVSALAAMFISGWGAAWMFQDMGLTDCVKVVSGAALAIAFVARVSTSRSVSLEVLSEDNE